MTDQKRSSSSTKPDAPRRPPARSTTCLGILDHSNSDTVVYVGCGERGNEMAEVCDVYVSYGFSSIDKDIA
ncbi:hypothetical protein Syun_023564 [Stephania yunnanensis]|uniref:Uncharacterized protein n=1 Tax=Stephania yunnanensis TaxID=152371 RepID=A0AAP0FH86_9MAGN